MQWHPAYIEAFILGLIGGVIPGPVLTAIFTEILQSGFAKSLRIIFISLITETIVAILSLLLVILMNFQEGVFRMLSFAGAVILIWIAISIWKVKSLDTGERIHFSIFKIILMILSNGVLWTYWITICIPQAMLLGANIQLGEYLFMILVQMGWLTSTIFAAMLFAQFRSSLSKPGIVSVVFRIFSLAFIYFALDMTYKSILYFAGG
jgi:threonine/homoserine/homoserine lactone efflux protein